MVPPGFGPGSQFTVDFAPSEVAPPTAVPIDSKMSGYGGSAAAPSPAPAHADDGFASGFNNPGWTPPPATAPTASAQAYPVGSEPEIQVSATATPVYSSKPY